MSFKDIAKKILFSVTGNNRVVLLDYPIVPKRLYTEVPSNPHRTLYQLINDERFSYTVLLNSVLKYEKEILTIKEDKEITNQVDPGWNNGYFPGLDIIMLYTLLSELKPRNYLEIGSGTSTRVAYKAKKENNLLVNITSIDPFPRKEIKSIVNRLEQTEVQKIPLDYFRSLDEGDILFFDGTHTLYPNSDVMWFFLEVLPIIKKGVYVHIHDVYLPYDYPTFMCDRYYNEQYILASCLLNAPKKYKIICPNYFISTDKELHAVLQPLWHDQSFSSVEKHGGSFWFLVSE